MLRQLNYYLVIVSTLPCLILALSIGLSRFSSMMELVGRRLFWRVRSCGPSIAGRENCEEQCEGDQQMPRLSLNLLVLNGESCLKLPHAEFREWRAERSWSSIRAPPTVRPRS